MIGVVCPVSDLYNSGVGVSVCLHGLTVNFKLETRAQIVRTRVIAYRWKLVNRDLRCSKQPFVDQVWII